MLCFLAGNYQEAVRFASANLLDDDEWFFPYDEDDLRRRKDFHVIIVGTAGMNVPPSYFERILALARERGRMK